MLKARSFNGEIILTHESRTEIAAQWQWRMSRMGYGHTVVVVRGEHSCDPLRRLFGNIGCVWFAHSYDGHSRTFSGVAAAGGAPAGRLLAAGHVGAFFHEGALWRLQLTAMVARLGGHNVLAVDTDVLLMDDFYWWMKQPDYQGYALLSQYDSKGALNPGLMYVRGAAPDGPVAWALADAALRNVRWLEHPDLQLKLNMSQGVCQDHSVVTDAVLSALAGRPLWWRCMALRPLDREWASREDGEKAFNAAHEQLVNPRLKEKVFSADRPGPACHVPVLPGGRLTAPEGSLAMPHAKGEWPPELGGMPFGERGPAARAFVQMMEEAGTPMWPDPEDASDAARAAAVPSERFAFLSRHVACDWATCGALGMFQAQLMRGPGEEPCVVWGHVGVAPGGRLAKRFQLLAAGQYHVGLGEVLHGKGGSFFATNVHHLGGSAHHAMRAGVAHARPGQQIPIPKVLALLPGALSPGPAPASSFPGPSSPLALVSKEHYVRLVAALSSVAVVAGRSLAVPRTSCDHPWMHREGSSPSPALPLQHLRGEAFAPFGPSLANLSCEWQAWVHTGCLHGPVHVEGRGHTHVNPHPQARMLLSLEFEHYLSVLPQAEREPAQLAADPNLLRLPLGAAADADGVYNITTAQLDEQLAKIPPEYHLVWVERPMRVTDLSPAARMAHFQWTSHCCGLSWPESRNRLCHWDF